MKTFTAALMAALSLGTATVATAEVLCDNCTAAFPGRYLGSYWPGDRGTFNGGNASPVADLDDSYVIDFNDNVDITINASGDVPGFWAELYLDAGSICTQAVCEQVVFGPRIGAVGSTGSRWTIKGKETPGRLILRVQGGAGGHYRGTLTVRRWLTTGRR